MIKSILLMLLGLALLNSCTYLQQSSMIFFPDKILGQTPAEWGLAYEDVFLDTDDGIRLHGWYIPHHGSKQTLLFFHGNAGNISHLGEKVFQAANEPKSFVKIRGDHNNGFLMSQPEYERALGAFVSPANRGEI